MPWYDSLTGRGFRDWLVTITAGARVPQGQRLDPFATSMRVFKQAGDWLTAIEGGVAPAFRGGHGRHQNEIDLQAADLVVRGHPATSLTPLGHAVLARWRECGICDDEDTHELARCVAVAALGIQLGVPSYVRMVEFWRELRELTDAGQLLASPHALYMASYLNQEVAGYNPWPVLRANAPDFVNEVADWEAIKAAYPGAQDVTDAVDELSRRVDSAAARATGRVAFCRAMELVCQGGLEAVLTLDRWGVAGNEREAALLVLGTLTLASAEATELLDLLMRRRNVVLYGPPGTGKTRAALGLSNAWAIQNGPDTVFRVTFHPSYSYEDFIEGYRPVDETTVAPDGDAGAAPPANDDADPEPPAASFKLQPGVFLEACKRAERLTGAAEGGDPKRVLVFIDEINRGDVARIFGELITYIEPDKRGESFRLAQSPGTSRSIPENVLILGTMNTADKSISLLDIALRRRFAFVEYEPDATVFQSEPSWRDTIDDIEIGRLLTGLNDRLLEAGVEPDRAIGHSLLAVHVSEAAPLDRLRERITHDVYPIVCEYCFMDRTRISEILDGLVDPNGRLASLQDDEFRAAVLTISAQENDGAADDGAADDGAADDNPEAA